MCPLIDRLVTNSVPHSSIPSTPVSMYRYCLHLYVQACPLDGNDRIFMCLTSVHILDQELEIPRALTSPMSTEWMGFSSKFPSLCSGQAPTTLPSSYCIWQGSFNWRKSKLGKCSLQLCRSDFKICFILIPVSYLLITLSTEFFLSVSESRNRRCFVLFCWSGNLCLKKNRQRFLGYKTKKKWLLF